MFALFEDDFTIIHGPQASLPAAAQPAVMDVRPLRGRSLANRHRKEKQIVPIVSIVFKTSASNKPKKTGNVVIWSFGHFDVFKENEKGTEGKKKTKETKKKVNIKKLKL